MQCRIRYQANGSKPTSAITCAAAVAFRSDVDSVTFGRAPFSSMRGDASNVDNRVCFGYVESCGKHSPPAAAEIAKKARRLGEYSWIAKDLLPFQKRNTIIG